MAKSQTKISFEGLNLTRTLNILSAKFTLFDVYRQGKFCQITVKSRAVRQVVAFLTERCYNITDVQKIGRDFALEFFKKHFLLPVFFVLCVATIWVSSQFCWKISVSGDFSESQVVDALGQCEMSVGKSLYKFSADVLENRLANKLDAMYAVINRKGSTLFVNVVKKRTVEQPINMHVRRDIVATTDGKVTGLLCEQGTAVVKVGDTVKKGDLLIVGLRTYNDGTTQDVYALGRVTLQLSASGFAQYTGTVTETVQTGETYTANFVVLFGKSYGKLPNYTNYRTEKQTVQLFPLNLTLERVTFFQTVQETKRATLEECLDVLKATALQLATEQAQFEILSVDYLVNSTGVTAVVYGQTEIK